MVMRKLLWVSPHPCCFWLPLLLVTSSKIWSQALGRGVQCPHLGPGQEQTVVLVTVGSTVLSLQPLKHHHETIMKPIRLGTQVEVKQPFLESNGRSTMKAKPF